MCRFQDFHVIELDAANNLKTFFDDCKLTSFFKEYITNLKHFPGKVSKS